MHENTAATHTPPTPTPTPRLAPPLDPVIHAKGTLIRPTGGNGGDGVKVSRGEEGWGEAVIHST